MAWKTKKGRLVFTHEASHPSLEVSLAAYKGDYFYVISYMILWYQSCHHHSHYGTVICKDRPSLNNVTFDLRWTILLVSLWAFPKRPIYDNLSLSLQKHFQDSPNDIS